jgi:hypothetical protein
MSWTYILAKVVAPALKHSSGKSCSKGSPGTTSGSPASSRTGPQSLTLINKICSYLYLNDSSQRGGQVPRSPRRPHSLKKGTCTGQNYLIKGAMGGCVSQLNILRPVPFC